MKQVAAALVKAQQAFGPALKTSTNPAFKSRYADLSACVEAVIDALNANGIALVQRNIGCDSGVCVETVFVHESGEMLSSGPLHVPAAKQDPQGYGSALTYARRYSLMAACGIAPEDDDGNAGTQAKRDSDNSPAAFAKRIAAGIKGGDVSGASAAFYSKPDEYKKAVWALITGAEKKAITDHKEAANTAQHGDQS